MQESLAIRATLASQYPVVTERSFRGVDVLLYENGPRR